MRGQFLYFGVFQTMFNMYCVKTHCSTFSDFSKLLLFHFWKDWRDLWYCGVTWFHKVIQNGRTRFPYSYSFAEVKLFLSVRWMC